MKKLLLGAALALALCGQVSANPVTVEGYQKFSITSTATNVVCPRPGVLHLVVVNTPVASATIKLYDAITATNIFGTITLPSTIASYVPSHIVFDVPFTALTIVTSGATDLTVTFKCP